MSMYQVDSSSHQTMNALTNYVSARPILGFAFNPVAAGVKLLSLPITLLLDFGFGVRNAVMSQEHKWEHIRNKCLISPAQHIAYAVTTVVAGGFLGAGTVIASSSVLGMGLFIAAGAGFAPPGMLFLAYSASAITLYVPLSLMTPTVDKAARTAAEFIFGGTYSIFQPVQPEGVFTI